MNPKRQRLYTIVGGTLAFLMAITLILPGLAPATPPVQQQTPPTLPPPTLPPPPVNFEGLSFEARYLHPSGLYVFGQPEGFTPTRPSNNGVLVQINMNNNDTLSVIEAIVEVPSGDAPVAETLEELSARLDATFMESSWRSYTSWRETARFIDQDNGRVVIDFELRLGQQRYLARHVAWIEDGWGYNVRSIAPENARDYLLFLLENSIPTLERVDAFVGTPVGWTALYSPEEDYIIRHPTFWRVVDGAPGSPVTLEGNGVILRLETQTGTVISDEAEAGAFVLARRPGAEIVSVAPAERGGVAGFSVAYSLTTLDGASQSGVALLLNGDSWLYIADARVNRAGLDFNALPDEGVSGEVLDVVVALDIYTPTVGMNLPDDVDEADLF